MTRPRHPARSVRRRQTRFFLPFVLLGALGGVDDRRSDAADLSFAPQMASDHPPRAGRLARQRVVVTNNANEDAVVACISYATNASVHQFGRVFGVPANSRRRTSHPLLLPPPLADVKTPLEIRSELAPVGDSFDASSDGRSSERNVRTSQVLLDADPQSTAILVDEDDALLLARVARVMAGQSARLYVLAEDSTMPASADLCAAWDQLVIASPRFGDDPQAVLATRRWLQQGGNVWLMLDKSGEAQLAMLLGDAWLGALLDRSSIVQCQLVDNRPVVGRRDGPQHLFQDPVDLVRVDGGGGAVDYLVDGWPAALRFRVGQGTLLVTTLGPRAWLAELARDDLERVSDRRAAQQIVKQAARMPLGVEARQFFRPMAPRPIATQTLRAAASRQIGYRVPSRWIVAAALGSLCSAVVACGLLLHRRGLAEWNLLAAPAAALVATGLLAGLGFAHRSQTPDTLASAEVVSVVPDAGEFHSQCGIALFRRDATDEPIEGTGSLYQFDAFGQEGRVRQTLWTSLERWRIVNFETPSGMTGGQGAEQGFLPPTFAARAAFSAAGLIGQIQIPARLASSSGVLLNERGPALAANVKQDGTFLIDGASELPPDRFSDAPLVGDRALRREELMRELFSGDDRSAVVTGPTLACWTDRWQTLPQLAGVDAFPGEALALIPLALERPDSAASVQIPAGLISFEAVEGPDGAALTAAYSNVDRAWVDGSSRATSISLRFQMPSVVLPVALRSASLAVEIHAPGRDVTFSGWHGATPYVVTTNSSPVRQSLRIAIDDAEALALDPRGGFVLTIDVGRHRREETGSLAATGWRIAHVRLSAKGDVLDGE